MTYRATLSIPEWELVYCLINNVSGNKKCSKSVKLIIEEISTNCKPDPYNPFKICYMANLSQTRISFLMICPFYPCITFAMQYSHAGVLAVPALHFMVAKFSLLVVIPHAHVCMQ